MDRLREHAVDAVPQIMKLVEESSDSAERVRLKQLALGILSNARQSEVIQDMDRHKMATGVQYIPKTMRYVFHYRPKRLLESPMFSSRKSGARRQAFIGNAGEDLARSNWKNWTW